MEDYILMEKMRRMEALMHRLHRRARHGAEGWRAGPHMGQGRVLTLLKMQPDISQKQLSYLLDMRPQSLSELLSKLERAGFITREPSQEDRRVMNIHLTEAGAQAANETASPYAAGIFKTFTDEEQDTLAALLDKLIEGLEGHLAELDEEEGGDFQPPYVPCHPCGPREDWGPGQMRGPRGPRGPHGEHGPHCPHGLHGEHGPHGDHGQHGPHDSWRLPAPCEHDDRGGEGRGRRGGQCASHESRREGCAGPAPRPPRDTERDV